MPSDDTLQATLVALETRFWQSLVDQTPEVALPLLTEPAFMVGPHGTLQFDHAAYRRMATQGRSVLRRIHFDGMTCTPVGDGAAVLRYDVTQATAPRDGDAPDAAPAEQRLAATSTWVRCGDGWRCAMHTESPATGA